MKRIQIFKAGKEAFKCEAPISEADAWLAQGKAENWFGKPEELEVVETDITVEVEKEKKKQTKINAGKEARKVCEQVLDYISGENLGRSLTMQQITDMQTLFADAENALRSGRPSLAKSHISGIVPDEVLVTTEMKSTCLEMLKDF